MKPTDGVWDVGLQPERTSLAWQRLALALLGLALMGPKLAWHAFGAWVILPTALVVVGAILLYSGSQQRYLGHHTQLRAGRRRSLPDGRLVLVTAVSALVLAVLGLGVVIAGS